MRGLHTLNAAEMGAAVETWQQCQAFGDKLGIKSVWYVGKRMQAGGHAGERDETVAAMEIEWSVTQNVAAQQQPPLSLVPPRKGEFPDEPVCRTVTPFEQALKEQGCIGELREAVSGHPEQSGEFSAVVEPEIGNEAMAAPLNGLTVEAVLGQNGIEVSTERQLAVVPVRGAPAVDALSLKDSIEGIKHRSAVKRPKAGDRSQQTSPLEAREAPTSRKAPRLSNYDLLCGPSPPVFFDVSAAPAWIDFTSGLRHVFFATSDLLRACVQSRLRFPRLMHRMNAARNQRFPSLSGAPDEPLCLEIAEERAKLSGALLRLDFIFVEECIA